MATTSDDRWAISDVLHRYCELLDARAPASLVTDVYAPDAEDDRRRGTPRRGAQELLAYFTAALDTVEATVHQLGNVVVRVDGDDARASSSVTACHWFAATAHRGPVRESECVLLARYDDELRRLRQGWRIIRRRVTPGGPGGLLVGRIPAAFRGFGGVTGGGPGQD